MNILKIGYSDKISQNNKQNQNKMSCALMLPYKASVSDKISFGMSIPKGPWGILMKVIQAGGNFYHLKSEVEEGINLLAHGDSLPGIKKAIQLANDFGGHELQTSLTRYDDFINEAASHAIRLSDDSFTNQDIKRKLLEATFLAETRIHTSIYETHNLDYVPRKVKELFIGLNSRIYGEFKQNLLEEAVIEKKIMFSDLDSLLSDVGDSNFKNRLMAANRQEIKRYEIVTSTAEDDNYHPMP